MALVARLRVFCFAGLLCVPVFSGSIAGRVTNSVTGAGIGGAQVSFGARSGNQAGQVLTDDTGAYRIEGIPDGQYTVYAGSQNFARLSPAAPPPVSVSGDAHFDIQLMPLASLRGRVLDPEGNPVAGLTVQLGNSSVVTDREGAFIVEKLSPRSYKLSVKVKPQADGKDGERLVTTYFPSTMYPEQAAQIKVEGVDLFGYEIRLRTAPARTIRGVVLDSNGKPAARASVTLAKSATPESVMMMRGVLARQSYPLVESPWEGVPAGDDGTFEFAAALEGDWRIKASVQGYDYDTHHDTTRTGAVEVRVGRNDVENVAVRLAPAFEIDVSADWGDSAPARLARMTNPMLAYVIPMEGQQIGGIDDGTLNPKQRMEGSAGRYLIGPGLTAMPGYYLAAAMLDGRDALWQVVELSGPTALKMVYKADGGSVRGKVEKGGGATVVLLADPTIAARFGLSAKCDDDGNFTIVDVPPGSYTVAAFQNVAVNDSGGTEFLNRVDAKGERVKVEAGSAAMVELRAN